MEQSVKAHSERNGLKEMDWRHMSWPLHAMEDTGALCQKLTVSHLQFVKRRYTRQTIARLIFIESIQTTPCTLLTSEIPLLLTDKNEAIWVQWLPPAFILSSFLAVRVKGIPGRTPSFASSSSFTLQIILNLFFYTGLSSEPSAGNLRERESVKCFSVHQYGEQPLVVTSRACAPS